MNILIAEDDMTSRLLLSATLRKLGHEVVVAHDGQEAWDAMQEEQFSLLISDWMMPGIDGLELCRRVRAANWGHYSYLILLTALGGKGRYLDGMDAGADDFITKPFDEEQLAARLRVASRILDLHEKLREEATHDSLTGLLNRRAIVEKLSHELERGARDEKPLSVMMLDLDHFKRVNDSCGHAGGDAVLREAARSMKNALRSYDAVGRYGGEEFLMIAPGYAEVESLSLAERIRAAVASQCVETPLCTLSITCSVGVAVSDGKNEDAESLILRADHALYRAKAKGRNCTELAKKGESVLLGKNATHT